MLPIEARDQCNLAGRSVEGVDISVFDFDAPELGGLLLELAPVAKAIDLEPRLHQEDEMARTAEGWVPMHEGQTGPTFRVRCRLRSDDDVLARFVVLASSRGISTVSDHDGWVRLRHVRADAAAG